MQCGGSRPNEAAEDTGDVRLGGVSSEGTAAGGFHFEKHTAEAGSLHAAEDPPIPTGFLLREDSPVQVQTGIPGSLAGRMHAA